jgi:Na+/melibiose symporter-like transporter
MGWAMIPDTIEYGEWKTGTRTEGISFAVYSFSQKLATAIAGIVVASVLQWSDYVPNLANQKNSTLTGILSTLTIIPIIFMVLSIAVIKFYKIDSNLFKRIIGELKLGKEGVI